MSDGTHSLAQLPLQLSESLPYLVTLPYTGGDGHVQTFALWDQAHERQTLK